MLNPKYLFSERGKICYLDFPWPNVAFALDSSSCLVPKPTSGTTST